MKILFETDPHFKELGSLSNESRYNPTYSTRLDFIVKSFSWFYDLARQHNVDMVVHGGDIFDKPIITAKEGHAVRESFAQNTTGIPEYVLVGNHDRKDIDVHALAILANYPAVHIIDEPTKIGNISFLPYTDIIDYDVLGPLQNPILFSHVDILGTQFSKTVVSTKGFDPEMLKEFFKVVFNGHIHTPSFAGVVYNTGAFIGGGLGDDYTHGIPSAILIDTETLQVSRIPNPYAIQYRTIVSNDLLEIKKQLNALIEQPYSFYLRVQCLNEVKTEVRLLINKYLEDFPQILSAIVVGLTRPSHERIVGESKTNTFKTSSNPVEILLGFIKAIPDNKLPASRKDIEAMILEEYTIGGN